MPASWASLPSPDRRARARIPPAGLADLRRQRPPERLRDEPRRGQDALQRDPRCPARRVEEVDQVLGGEVAGGAGRVRAAAGPAGRRIEAADPGIETGGDVRQGGPARVVEVVARSVRAGFLPPRPARSGWRPGPGRRRRWCRRSRPRRRRGRAAGVRPRSRGRARPDRCTGSRRRSTHSRAATSRARPHGPGRARRRPAIRRRSSRCWPG